MLCCCQLQFLNDQRDEYARHWSLSKGWSLNHQEIIMCDKIIKLVSLNRPERFQQQNRVYSVKGISPTLNSVMGNGGNNIPLFLIVKEI